MVEAATGGVLSKKGVLENFVKFTGQHLCQSLFFNKVAGLKPLCSYCVSRVNVHDKNY